MRETVTKKHPQDADKMLQDAKDDDALTAAEGAVITATYSRLKSIEQEYMKRTDESTTSFAYIRNLSLVHGIEDAMHALLEVADEAGLKVMTKDINRIACMTLKKSERPDDEEIGD